MLASEREEAMALPERTGAFGKECSHGAGIGKRRVNTLALRLQNLKNLTAEREAAAAQPGAIQARWKRLSWCRTWSRS